MPFTFFRGALCFAAVVLTLIATVREAHAQAPKDVPNNPVAIRKALEENITLDYVGKSFDEIIEHLRQKTKLKIVVDQTRPKAVYFAQPQVPLPPGVAPAEFALPAVTFKIDNAKLRAGLRSFLGEYDLTFVIIGDSVVIATEEAAQMRQLRQRISVDITNQPLGDALKKLADDTGVNLLVEPQMADKAKTKITAQLDDVALETVVRLLAKMADLSCVSVENVIVVTSDERADKLRKESAPIKTVVPPPPVIAYS
ncbi:MAG TPA: hypothetical protein VE988_18575 [Gemmataceae bacterium]|nr:hypothetical protein [Gemmataceae bacterium]